MLQNMVDYAEHICQSINSTLANILTFNTSGIELYVTDSLQLILIQILGLHTMYLSSFIERCFLTYLDIVFGSL